MNQQNNLNLKNLWVVILAAGKGKRMKSKEKNKVTYELSGSPMILRTINNIKETGINNILVVVGFAKESVINLLDKNILIAEQKKRLGTGHALKIALNKIPKICKHVLVLYGDDSFLYTKEILIKLIDLHLNKSSKLSFLTLEVENPDGLGRVIRDRDNNVIGIVEEKDANFEQKKIKEINPACYIFSADFLRKYINKISKSKITGEYYLPELTRIAIENSERIETLKLNNLKWRGVNTFEELKQAETILNN